MHIFNIMFSKDLGGIEQSFIDYSNALLMSGHKVTALIFPGAKVKKYLLKNKINIIEVDNLGCWDFIAKSNIKKIIGQNKPDIIIAHGNRAVSLAKKPASNLPIIGVTHNYSIKKLIGLDAIFATTEDLKNLVIDSGQDKDSVFKIPNMIKMPSKPAKIQNFSKPVIIGTMGRFVKKKGFDVFIQALAELKKRNIEFKAVIGGRGEERHNLEKLSTKLGLDDNLQFLGWIEDKNAFFESIDIFCLPSLHEPFGIILLEAFSHKKPVVTTDSEGPNEIASDNIDALIVPKNNYLVLASAMEELTSLPDKAKSTAKSGYKTAKNYEMKEIAKKINNALLEIKTNHQAT